MLYYGRTDVSEGIGVNKTKTLKECIICHYMYFLDKGFKFQPDVCNGYHDVLTFGDIEIEERTFHRYKNLNFLKDMGIYDIIISNKIPFGEKNYNTLLITWMIIIKLNHYA